MEDTSFLVYEYGDVGQARATEEVVAKIAGLAATEAEGVESLNGIYREHIARISRKSLSSGVKVVRHEKSIDILLAMVLKMGYNIPAVTEEVQEKVKSAVENMTGITVGAVNIQISNLKVEK